MRPNINNENLVEAVEQAAVEHGSKTDAVRHAIEQQFVNDSDDGDTGTRKVNHHLRSELQKAHRILWELQHGESINSKAALSVLAQKMSIEKTVCKQMYIEPLRKEDMVRMDAGMKEVQIFVRDPDETVELDSQHSDGETEISVDDPDDADQILDEITKDEETAA